MSNKGFTLLEVLIVIGIMGLVAAMVWPLRATLDDSQRRRVTYEHIDAIREAIVGHSQVIDRLDMGRIISGYVGDMGDWPKLWEPEGTGVGGERGAFMGEVFRFSVDPATGQPLPYEVVSDPTAETLGQPRGLWTRFVSNANNTGTLEQDQWRGPYLSPPAPRNTAAGSQYATTTAEYQALIPEDRAYFHLLQGDGQLQDGWNRSFRFFLSRYPAEPGSDDDEVFWIVSLGADGRATFPPDIQDYDETEPGNQDNIVIQLKRSEWAPILQNQHLRSSSTIRLIQFTEDNLDRIARALVGDAPAVPNTGYTGDLLGWPDLWNWVCRFEEGLPGPLGPVPCGTCRDSMGDTVDCSTPEAAYEAKGAWEKEWDDAVLSLPEPLPYTYGQPRGLWDQGDLPHSEFGVGWRHGYIESPRGRDSREVLLDAWDRPYHFFTVTDGEKDHLLIISGGPSGSGVFQNATRIDEVDDPEQFDFFFPQPAFVPSVETPTFDQYLRNRAATFDLENYNPSFNGDVNGTVYNNTDNILRLVRQDEWKPGFLRIETLRVDNVPDDTVTPPYENVKCRLFGVLNAAGDRDDRIISPDSETHNATELFWETGNATNPLFRYDDVSSVNGTLVSGARYFVCWQDTGGVSEDEDNNFPDPGEEAWWKIFSVRAHPARIVGGDVLIDADGFVQLP